MWKMSRWILSRRFLSQTQPESTPQASYFHTSQPPPSAVNSLQTPAPQLWLLLDFSQWLYFHSLYKGASATWHHKDNHRSAKWSLGLNETKAKPPNVVHGWLGSQLGVLFNQQQGAFRLQTLWNYQRKITTNLSAQISRFPFVLSARQKLFAMIRCRREPDFSTSPNLSSRPEQTGATWN